ncbi:MAG: helix-turn-helix domain-containing protein [Sphingomicrobium sp.]
MAARRVNPYVVKLHWSYSIPELAARLGVHKNTVRHWQRDGLAPIDASRPVMFQGSIVRAFLAKRNASRKRPCPPGTLYCFRCREPRPPALGMIEYLAMTAVSGNLAAICAMCDTVMHRRARLASLPAIMPGFAVQITQAPPRLKGSPSPSLNCDLERQVTT